MNQIMATLYKLYNTNLYLLDLFDLRKSYQAHIDEIKDLEIMNFYLAKLVENSNQIFSILERTIDSVDYNQLFILHQFLQKMIALRFYQNTPLINDFLNKIEGRIKNEDISKYLNPTI